MPDFQVVSSFVPDGDQPQAVEKLAGGVRDGKKFQTLMGVTGSGKTFTMAHVVAKLNRPTLVISHNKTLAAQLYEEFKELFPHNAVGYFVSYYDYYQPEAYIPQRDIYIEKDASRNDDLDRLRLAATSNLVSRRDVLLVASVSCIFGLGSPNEYRNSVLPIRKDAETDRDEMLRKLIDLQYSRNDIDFKRGTFRVRGDVVELHPSYEEFAYRIEFFGEQITNIDAINPLTGELLKTEESIFIYPAVHYVMPPDRVAEAVRSIKAELEVGVMRLRGEGKLLEAQRLLARTKYDLEMMQEVGYCSGIENYSRHLDGRKPGEKPYTLIDYFPKDYLLIIDESHVTLPQIKAMFNGDKARKQVLVDHGFRLPSAMDNRPLKYEEFEEMINQCVYVSATPGKIELEKTGGEVVEQVIRPTGLIDPEIFVHPAQGQVPHLLAQIKERTALGERVLVTTLTKRLAEDLSAYIQEAGIRGRYLHSEIQTLERVEILGDLRKGDFDVLIGINLLREGLDLPEVSLVAILDADKEGFLRSAGSLIQTMGRAARHLNGRAILYADVMTASMRRAIDETTRRRTLQHTYNEANNITPQSIIKPIDSNLIRIAEADYVTVPLEPEEEVADIAPEQMEKYLAELEERMREAARKFDFKQAAAFRDRVKELRARAIAAIT
jgi:excinuclease ABC subunit B